MSTVPDPGEVRRVERTFTADDVRAFADLSRDDQPRHTESDEEGRLLVHGLLTATLPTVIGSDLGVLARTMDFHFRRPVYTGEHVVCEVTVDDVTEREGRTDLTASIECRRERDGEVVMTGSFEGLIRTG